MKIDWAQIAFKLPSLIQQSVQIVQHVKGAKGAEKAQAVRDSLPNALNAIEYGAGKDVFNDPAIITLADAVIDAEAAALKARTALQNGLLAKGVIVPTTAKE